MTKDSSEQPEDADPTLDFSASQQPPPPQPPPQQPGPALPDIPGVTLGPAIARGGMGVVYHGVQDYLDRQVAVKVLAAKLQGDDFNARFQREAKILAGIQHPNIVTCYSAGITSEDLCFMVMEYINGPTLLRWVQDRGPLPVGVALLVGHDLARALRRAHEAGIIHRDVKPENVLLERDQRRSRKDPFPYRSKLVDLGLARTTEVAEGLTAPGAILGTPSTMAPEQFDDPDGVDFRADIYGLGCVLYMALTASRAFPGSSIGKVLQRKQAELGPDPRELNPEVTADAALLVQTMLACDREDRPQSYDEIIARCRAMVSASSTVAPPSTWFVPSDAPVDQAGSADGASTPARGETAPSEAISQIGRRRGLSAALVAVAVLALVLAWALIPENDEPPKARAVDAGGLPKSEKARAVAAANAPPVLNRRVWRVGENRRVELDLDSADAPMVKLDDRLVLQAVATDDVVVDVDVRWTQLTGCPLPLTDASRLELTLDHVVPTFRYFGGPHLVFAASANDGYHPADVVKQVVLGVKPSGDSLFSFDDDFSLKHWQADANASAKKTWQRYDPGFDPAIVRARERVGETSCVLELTPELSPAAFCLSGAIEFVTAEAPEAAGLRLELEDGRALVLWLELSDERLVGVLGRTATPMAWPAQTIRRQALTADAVAEREKLDWMAFHIAVIDRQVHATWGRGDRGEHWVDREEVTISSSPVKLVMFLRSGHARFHDFRSRPL